MENNLKDLEIVAIEAAVKAGLAIMKIYQDEFEVAFKNDKSPLTIADKKANEIINTYLLKTNIPIISEENKQTDYEIRKNWEICWIVDPLDGTKEFIKRNGEFTVNIALIVKQKPLLGVIYVPESGELYVGNTTEKKTYKNIVKESIDFNNLKLQEIQRVDSKKNQLRIVGSRSHMNDETQDFVQNLINHKKDVKIVSKGSSLKFCLIAEAKADIYPRFAPTMEWDTAAGQAICEAVGAKVISNKTNKPLLYNKEDLLNEWFVVS